MDALTSFIVVIIAITIQFSLYAIKRLKEPLEPDFSLDERFHNLIMNIFRVINCSGFNCNGAF